MQNKHRRRIGQLLKRKQRRLGDFLNLTLFLSYNEDVDVDVADTASSTSDYIITSKESIGKEDDDDSPLRYYQGFHDVASIFLSALGGGVSLQSQTSSQDDTTLQTATAMGLTLPTTVLLSLSRTHFRDALRTNFTLLQSALKLIILPLLATTDPELHSHLVDCEMEPYFCLSWIITWFAHDVRDTALVKRLYDFFIVSHPLMVVYVCVGMMIHPLNRIEVLAVDCDFSEVHNALCELPRNSCGVGWKYTPGDNNGGGYVTGSDCDTSMDHEDDASFDLSLDDCDGSVLSSCGGLTKGNSAGNRARVPFQELIDLSISLMHKIPPRNLINLAKRYHTQITLEPLLAQSSSIALLQPPPTSGLASYTDSDWVVRQKMREGGGETKLNRHQRKVRLKINQHQQGAGISDGAEASRSSSGKGTTAHPLLEKPSIQAIIASGTGPDGRADTRKQRKKQRMMVRSVAVLMVAVLAALVKKKWSYSQQEMNQGEQQLTRGVLAQDNVAKLLLSSDDIDDPEATVRERQHVTRTKQTSDRKKKAKEIDRERTRAASNDQTPKEEDEGKGVDRRQKKDKKKAKEIDRERKQVVSNDRTPKEEYEGKEVDRGLKKEKEKYTDVNPDGEMLGNTAGRDKSLLAKEEPKEADCVVAVTSSSITSPKTELSQDEVLAIKDDPLPEEDRVDVNKKLVVQEQKKKKSVKKNDNDCANDEPEIAASETSVTESEKLAQKMEHPQEPNMLKSERAAHQVTLFILVKSSALFLKNLTMTLEQQFDFLMMLFMDLLQVACHHAKAGWLKVAPLLVNALHIGWHQVKLSWLRIAPIVKKELALEVNGESLEWAQDAIKTWKKKGGMLKNQGKAFATVSSDIVKKQRQRSKAKKTGRKEKH